MTKVCSSTTKTDDDDDLSAEVRGDFPILDSTNDAGMRIVYLDSAATSQKPKEVLEAHADFYSQSNANIAQRSAPLIRARDGIVRTKPRKVAAFIHAKTDREIVFTRNASEALNLIANTWGEKNVEEGDENRVIRRRASLEHSALAIVGGKERSGVEIHRIG